MASDLDDRTAQLEPYRGLHGSRERLRHPEFGPCFVCEGRYLVIEALAAGREGTLRVISVLATPRMAQEMAPLLPAGTGLIVEEEPFLRDWVGYAFHRGVLCCVEAPPPPAEETILDARRLLVLPSLHNVDNLGTLLRTAAALGVDAVVPGKGPDLLERRTVRVSMGAVWRIPVLRREDPGPLLRAWRAREAGSEIVGAALVPGALAALDWTPAPRTALVLGPEPDGLEADWLDLCDRHVAIPMANAMDSLNVAAAGAILMARLMGRL
jgi:tRNA G18 (ribose-2'-O)-methylase SpoU